MKVLVGLLLAAVVNATALTYRLGPNEKACFFTDVESKGAKMAFYFAVSWVFFWEFEGGWIVVGSLLQQIPWTLNEKD